MSDAVTEARALLRAPDLDLKALGTLLNAMSHEERVSVIRATSGKDQMKLWNAAEDEGTTLEDVVPSDVPPGTEVIHVGQNSLPVFRAFEKRFSRTASREDALYGYNEGQTRAVIGPGYFVAHQFDERGEVGVDYHMVPPDDADLPAGWPTVKPNEKGLQMFVFAGMVDYLRRVSDHVTIGKAWRKGKETPNTFVLTRTP